MGGLQKDRKLLITYTGGKKIHEDVLKLRSVTFNLLSQWPKAHSYVANVYATAAYIGIVLELQLRLPCNYGRFME